MRKYKVLVMPLLLFLIVISGCKNKKLVEIHTGVGELLIATKDQSVTLHDAKVISDNTYESIRINWLRAQSTYIQASILLEVVVSSKDADTTAYFQMLSQTNIILADIMKWIQEEKDKKKLEGGKK